MLTPGPANKMQYQKRLSSCPVVRELARCLERSPPPLRLAGQFSGQYGSRLTGPESRPSAIGRSLNLSELGCWFLKDPILAQLTLGALGRRGQTRKGHVLC